MESAEIVSLVASLTGLVGGVGSAIYMFYKTHKETRLAEEKQATDKKVTDEDNNRDNAKEFTDIAKGLIEPLSTELERVTRSLANANAKIDKLTTAIDAYLRDRQMKLKDIPTCVQCLESDVQFKATIRAIILNGGANKASAPKEHVE